MRIPRAIARRFRAAWRALSGAAVAEPEQAADESQAGWWDLLPFTTHRIRIGDGRFTMSTDGVDPERDQRTEILGSELGDRLAECTVVDLGCLEGVFSIEMARRGAKRVDALLRRRCGRS